MELKNLSMEELASYVCTELKKKDINVVLSGGSCMELYTNELYSSYDIDFVMKYTYSQKLIEQTMVELGFKIEGKYYILEESQFFIEILTPPVAVGDQFLSEFATRNTKVGTLTLLTANDCVKDRLCGCFYHDDKTCFEHALAVGHKNSIDKDELRNWAANEDKAMQEGVNRFLDILNMLENPTEENIKIFLKQFCQEEIIDINTDIGKQDFIDLLAQTYSGKILLSTYSKNELIDFLK